MAKRGKYSIEGELIMGAAAYHSKIYGVKELSNQSGIPQTTLQRTVSSTGNFGSTSMDNFRALVRIAGLTDEELVQVVRAGY